MLVMKRQTWQKQHKWIGIVLAVFLLLFCVSGIVLNHRRAVAEVGISRNSLPEIYRYKAWNNGLLRGTIALTDTDTAQQTCRKHILIYGKGGVWLTDSTGTDVQDFNAGLPRGADERAVMRIVRSDDGWLYCAAQYGLYQMRVPRGEREWRMAVWKEVPLQKDADVRLTDVTAVDSQVVVVTRSELFVVTRQGAERQRIVVQPARGETPRKSLFRLVWQLHSGELFGLTGRLIVDGLALVFIVLIVTGLAVWLLPKAVRRRKMAGKDVSTLSRQLRGHWKWHELVGRKTVLLTLLMAVTGAMLRPPLLIAIANGEVPDVFGTDNAWEDRLRMVRYDAEEHDWLLSTSDGFYSLKALDGVPERISVQAPVSMMGINVLERVGQQWLVGSFSGMYLWDRRAARVVDSTTGRELTEKPLPFGQLAVSGYSRDFGEPFTVTYYDGTDRLPQPHELSGLPMSLYNLCLEIHTGRIFTFLGTLGSFLYIFIIGVLTVWLLVSGWFLRRTGKS